MEIGEVLASETVLIEDNSSRGVTLRGSVGFHGPVVIQGNSIGVFSEGGLISACCAESVGTLEVLNNEVGIFSRGGHLDLNAPVRIQGNSSAGIGMRGASGRTINGVQITNNGTPGDSSTGGVLLFTGSFLDLNAVDVTDNRSFGLVIQDNSTAIFRATASFTNNDAEGVVVDRLSTARISTGAVLQNNGSADLRCTNGSLASGDNTQIGKLKCSGFIKDN